MKKLLPAIAILLLIVAIGLILTRKYGRDLDAPPSNDSMTNTFVPTQGSSREESRAARTRTSRPTLEESLPPGSKLIKSKKILGGIEVILADGSHICAKGVSVTDSGTSFEAPYEFTGANRPSLMISEDNGSVLLLARDGSSFKMIGAPGPGGTTTITSSLNIMEAEQFAAPNGP